MKDFSSNRRRFWLLVVGVSGLIFGGWLVWFGREIRETRAQRLPSESKISRPDVSRTLEQIFNQMGKSLEEIPSLADPSASP